MKLIMELQKVFSMIKGFDAGYTTGNKNAFILNYEDRRYKVTLCEIENPSENMMDDIKEYLSKNECLVLSACNEWKEYSSARAIGIYTDINALRKEVWNLFMKNEMKWDNKYLKSILEEASDKYTLNSEDLEECENNKDEINDYIESEKDRIYKEIMNSNMYEINDRCAYLMVTDYELNEPIN